MPHIGTILRAWRISQKCSEQALAERAGISVSLLEALESEQLDPNASLLEAAAEALKIPLPWLFILPSELELLCKDEDEVPAPLSTLTGGRSGIRKNAPGSRTRPNPLCAPYRTPAKRRPETPAGGGSESAKFGETIQASDGPLAVTPAGTF